MAYFSSEPNELGYFGCGGDCSCKSCRTAAPTFSEVYEEEEPEAPPAAPKMSAWLGSTIADDDAQAASKTSARPLPYREAVEQTERKLFDEYTRACAGVRVLEMLRREAMSPAEEVHFWEKVIDWLPKIFELKRKLDEKVRAHEMSPTDAAANLAWQMRHVFPPGYALRSLDSELAAARCALSKARWQFMVWQRTGRIPGERRLLHGLVRKCQLRASR